jgi:hypothetical protein
MGKIYVALQRWTEIGHKSSVVMYDVLENNEVYLHDYQHQQLTG